MLDRLPWNKTSNLRLSVSIISSYCCHIKENPLKSKILYLTKIKFENTFYKINAIYTQFLSVALLYFGLPKNGF